MWWREEFVFTKKPTSRCMATEIPLESSGGFVAQQQATATAAMTSECMCIVTFPQSSQFFQQAVPVDTTVGAAVSMVAEKRSDRKHTELASLNVFSLLSAPDGMSRFVLMDQEAKIAEYLSPGQPFILFECRSKPVLRSLTIVFGVAYNLTVEIPSAKLQIAPAFIPGLSSPPQHPQGKSSPPAKTIESSPLPPSGVLIYNGSMTVREAVTQLTASWGLTSLQRFGFLVPDRFSPGNTCKAEYSRTLWSYRLNPTDRAVFVDYEIE
jgi:hypothetical protein